MRPGLRHTYSFVTAFLGDKQRILEVGAGDGELAHLLASAGHDVVAIDSDPVAVAEARALGISAHVARWPEIDPDVFDAILFTRSLHHIPDLVNGVGRAAVLLRPGGQIIVEDFAFHSAASETISWFAELVGSLHGRGKIVRGRHALVDGLLDSADPQQTWHGLNDHEIHSADAMMSVIAARFALHFESDAPYLYRYVEQAADAETARWCFDVECAAGEKGQISLLGRRLVGIREG